MDIIVPTTVVGTVWITIYVTKRLVNVTWDVTRDILTLIAAKVNTLTGQ